MSHWIDPQKRVTFVAASDNTLFDHETPSTSATSYDTTNAMTGEETREFYESLWLGKPQKQSRELKEAISQQTPITVSQKKPTNQKQARELTNALTERDSLAFLKSASEGDLNTVEQYCSRGIDIEVEDMYKWTALMCAAAAGSKSVTDFLLRQGANIDHEDNSRRTAVSLAMGRGHIGVLEIIERHRAQRDEDSLAEYMDEKCHVNQGYCDICQTRYTGDKHETSMIHMICSGHLPSEGFAYGISQSNKGYRLLKNSGWSETRGLGKSGEGRKYPIKTILKRDLKGLGMDGKDKPRPRVTHFEPYDVRAVEDVKPKRREYFKQLSKRKEREQRLEIKFRRMLNE
ncbi:g-patch domain-containing protein [Ditylenchus destructor]|uniref:G-patch domain-containing protein n=1 Tax=Ditylenchus destructor TaxID=166010 RepID=A0AAD4NKP5_9BILA|nr:g-patch domain-containing protein [Ditylenchus destructor]